MDTYESSEVEADGPQQVEVLNEIRRHFHRVHWYPADLPNKTAEVKILYLCALFPWLGRKITFSQNGFDATFLEKASRPWSTGERQVALFIITVWAGHNWTGKGKQFDFTTAASTCGEREMEIITNWMKDPFWP